MRWAARFYHKALLALKQSSRVRRFKLRVEHLEDRSTPTVNGTVYIDFNQSGTQEPTEPGVQGIPVVAFDTAGNTLETVNTAADGTYTLTTNLSAVRVAFGPLPEGLLPGTVSPGAGSTVQFVNAALNPNGVDLGLNTYLLATNLYSYDDALLGQNASEPAIVTFQYGANGTPTQTTLATVASVGSTWGLAYQGASDSLFASSFMKRHAGFGPDATGQSPTTGGIYRINRGTSQVSLLIDLNDVPANLLAGGDAAANYETGVNPHPIVPESIGGDWYHDVASFNQVGRISLGGMAVSPDGSILYVVNLNTRSLVEIPLAPDGSLDTTRTLRQTPIPLEDPVGSGITNFNANDLRPFAVEVTDEGVFVGVTYTAQTLNDSAAAGAAGDAQRAEARANLRAFVYGFDPSTGTFRTFDQTSGGFTGVGTPEPVLTANLAYPRGYADDADPANPNDDVPATWQAWTANFGGVAGSPTAFPINPQPWLTDIAFDGDNIILGLRDRAGDQYGFETGNLDTTNISKFSGVATGDILRASPDGSGGWVLENNANSNGVTTGGAGNNQGPGNGEFYFEDEFVPRHQEVLAGGLAQIPGFSTVASSGIDPLDIFTGGVYTLRNSTTPAGAVGTTAARAEIYTTLLAGGAFGKANGIGDLEPLVATTSIQVGNRVFNDLDSDGIQDANEPGIPNVFVALFKDGSQVGIVSTDSDGQFLFEALEPNANYELRIDTTQTSLTGRTLATANQGTDDTIDSDPTLTGTDAIIAFTTGPAGTNNHTFDAGFTGGATASPLTLGETVWNDANNDGLLNNGELGVQGVVVELLDATGTNVLGTDTTDTQGNYSFPNLVPETYRVRLAESNFTGSGVLVGFTASGTTADPELNVNNDNNGAVSGILGQAGGFIISAPIVLTSDGEPTDDGDTDANTNLTLDFGVLEAAAPTTLTLGDTVFRDENNDGVLNGTDAGVANVAVQLLDATGTNILATATTNGQGQYTFPNIQPGTYRVRLAESNFTGAGVLVDFVSSPGAPDPNNNLNDDDNGDVVGTLGQTGGFIISGPITLALNDEPTDDGDTDANTNLTLDFGVVPPATPATLTLGDTVFRDENNNGVLDGTEQGIANVAVELLDATGTNVLGNTTTNGQGVYTFANLQAGSYVVRLAESNFTGVGVLVGFVSSATVADPNNNIDDDNNGSITGTLGQAGGFVASGPIALAVGDEPIDDGDTDNNTNLSLDFGMVPPPVAPDTLTLGDTVFRDENNNGLRDGTEAGVVGVTVELLDATGTNLLGTTTTNAQGVYTFANLQEGTYRVRLAESNFTGAGVLVNFTSSTGEPDPNNNTNDDDNGAIEGTLGQSGGIIISGPITLALNTEPTDDGDTDANTNLTLDFGVVPPATPATLTLGDTVFRDENNNGVLDGTEQGIANVAVELLDATGTNVLGNTTTNGQGVYTFANLQAGSYVVRLSESNFTGVGVLVGFVSSTTTVADPNNNIDDDNNGSITGTLGQAGGFVASGPIALAVGDEPINDGDTDNNTNLSLDFGMVPPPATGTLSLGDTVWNDANNDGLLNNGELGIQGVTVELLNAAGTTVLQTATTDVNGKYVFATLPAGDYIVRLAASNFQTGGPLVGFRSSTGTNGSAVGNFEGAATPDPDTNTDNDDNGTTTGTLGTASGFVASGVITLAENGEPTTDGDTDANTNLTVDFGLFRSFSVGNVVFNDANNNGSQDGTEAGIGGVEVRLRDSAGVTQIATTTTDAQGQYLFTNLVAGDYLVELAANNFQTGGALVGFQSSVGTGSAFEGANTPDPDSSVVDGDDNGTTSGSLGTTTGVIQSLPFTLGPTATEPTGETPTNDASTPDAQSNLTIDFGVFQQAQPNTLTLGDTVFNDTNNNGLRDGTETGIAGVTVQLLDADATNVLATAVTNSNGTYTFANLQAGTYRVRLAEVNFQGAGPLVGFTSSTNTAADPNNNVNDDNNGSVTGTLGQTGGFIASGQIALALGQEPTTDGDTDNNTNLSLDFGVRQATTGTLTLGDSVFRDENNNGTRDGSEVGITGVTVELLDSTGTNVLATTTTNAQGVYTFPSLQAGTYRVRLAASNFQGAGVLVGFTNSLAVADPENNINNDNNGNVSGTLGQANGFVISGPITLAVGQEPTNDGDSDNNTNLSLDFGMVPPPATGPLSLGNTVWNDTNNNGLRDGTEAGIQGVVVELVNAAGTTVLQTVTTDSAGQYLFINLAAGEYRVRLAASNFQGTGPLVGLTSSTGTNGAASGAFEGASTPDPDTDTNDDDNGQVSGTLGTATGFIISAPITLVENGEPTSDGDTDANTNLSLDFGVFRPFSLGNVVFNDTNNNGSQGTGETGIGGVTVRLLDATGTTQIATTTTNGAGQYLFSNLVAGDYIVELAASNFQTGGPLVGFQSSTGGTGNTFEGANTPDPDTTATDGDDNGTTTGTLGTATGFIRSLPVTLGPTADEPTGENPNNDTATPNNQSNLTVDFGVFQQTPNVGSIRGRVFLDYNNSGTFNGPDTGLSGVTLALSGPNLTTPITIQTDAQGNFSFDNVPAGSYTLTQTQPTTPANQNGKTTAGTSGGTVSGNTISNITLTAGQTATGYLFAEIPLVSTGGSVYEDLNGNGNRDTGEPGIAGVTITLTGTSIVTNAAITARTTTTDADGNYIFNDLQPGVYTIAETQPSGFVDGRERNGTPAAATVSNDRFTNIDLTNTAAVSTGFLFGEAKASSLAGSVYNDADSDGVRDTGETGIANVLIRLTGTDAQGATVNRTTRTDSSGNFSFQNLLPGTYRLTETQPSSFRDGIETAGTSGGTVGTNQISNIVLASGVNATGYLFGEEDAPDLVLTETVSRNRVRTGQTVVLTYTVRNAGSAIAEDATTAINLGGLQFLSSSSTSFNSATNRWTIGDMDPNETQTLQITARVPGRGTFATSARVSASNTELRTTNNSDAEALTGTSGVTKQSYLASSFFGPTAINRSASSGGTTTLTTPTTPTNPNPVNPTTPTLALAAASDTGVVGDNRTNESTVSISGTTTPGSIVTLLSTGATTTADASGLYLFSSVPLTLGNNTVTVRATNSTGGSSQASQVITRNTPPVVGTPVANVNLSSSQTSQVLDLAGNFTDADTTNSRVRLNTSSGAVNIELFDAQAPRTVANFMNYIKDGKYTDTIFHRSVSNFVVQGGGFKYTGTPPTATLPSVVTDPPVQNEPDPTNRSNLRGTVAMAKLGGDPNSATSQFFFNLGNNAANLDNQNGGFTVFGKLVDAADQTVVDNIAAIPVQNRGGAFNEIPLNNYSGTSFPGDATKANFVTIDSASIVSQTEGLTYTVVNNTNPSVVTTNIDSNRLTVAAVAGQTGTATITIRATDFSGGSVETTFTVTVS